MTIQQFDNEIETALKLEPQIIVDLPHWRLYHDPIDQTIMAISAYNSFPVRQNIQCKWFVQFILDSELSTVNKLMAIEQLTCLFLENTGAYAS